MKCADLHCHSYYSDGVLSPTEVVRRAKNNGVKMLALTDHNSVSGVKEAIEVGKIEGVKIIPAIEIKFGGGEVLGYFVNIEDSKFLDSLEKIKKPYLERMKKICIQLSLERIQISFEDLKKAFPLANNNFTWTHILYYLYNKNLRNSLSEISSLIFGKIRWNKIKEISAEEAIEIVVGAGGIPILAHPWITKKSKALLEEPKISQLVRRGLRGLEFDQGDRNEKRSEEFIKKIKSIAKIHNLILTSGSDFHGDFLIDSHEDKFHHELGAHNCEENVFDNLSKLKIESQKTLF